MSQGLTLEEFLRLPLPDANVSGSLKSKLDREKTRKTHPKAVILWRKDEMVLAVRKGIRKLTRASNPSSLLLPVLSLTILFLRGTCLQDQWCGGN